MTDDCGGYLNNPICKNQEEDNECYQCCFSVHWVDLEDGGWTDANLYGDEHSRAILDKLVEAYPKYSLPDKYTKDGRLNDDNRYSHLLTDIFEYGLYAAKKKLLPEG